MIVSSRRPSSRPPSSAENGRGACRRLFCPESEGRSNVVMPMHYQNPVDTTPLRAPHHLSRHHDVLITAYDDTDSSSIPTVPSLSSVNSVGSNGYLNGGGGGHGTEFYEAMLREKRRELNSSPRVSIGSYNYPNQDSRIRALFEEMRPKVDESRLCGSTAASMTSFSSSPSPPQNAHRYDVVKPRVKLVEPDSWMRHNANVNHGFENAWKRTPFVENHRNKRHGAGDWSGRFDEFQHQDHVEPQPSKPFDYRNSKRQASFMAAVNGRVASPTEESVRSSDSSVLSPSFMVLSGYQGTPGKPPIPGNQDLQGTLQGSVTKAFLRSKKSNFEESTSGATPSLAAPRRRPRNDPRRKTIHDNARDDRSGHLN
ncbi:hypothetical protein L596_018151 [Steinernema carpocapsae]|nr:hypothetical protein L596_018151 [Steinernema carpocapsae]